VHRSDGRRSHRGLLFRRPGLVGRVLGDDGRQLVRIFLNGRSIRRLDGLRTPVADGDEIRLTPPIARG
jgi:molybdopterin converting factor small subunit